MLLSFCVCDILASLKKTPWRHSPVWTVTIQVGAGNSFLAELMKHPFLPTLPKFLWSPCVFHSISNYFWIISAIQEKFIHKRVIFKTVLKLHCDHRHAGARRIFSTQNKDFFKWKVTPHIMIYSQVDYTWAQIRHGPHKSWVTYAHIICHLFLNILGSYELGWTHVSIKFIFPFNYTPG